MSDNDYKKDKLYNIILKYLFQLLNYKQNLIYMLNPQPPSSPCPIFKLTMK